MRTYNPTGRRNLVVLFSAVLTGCLGNHGEAEEWVDQAIDILNDSFETVDPDDTISMPLSYELDEIEAELEDHFLGIEGLADRVENRLQADVRLLEASGEYLLGLIDSFRMFRSYYDVHDDGIIDKFPPESDSKSFKQGMEYSSEAGSNMTEARDIWKEIDKTRLGELGVEPTLTAEDIDRYANEAETRHDVAETLIQIEGGFEQMFRGNELYIEGSYTEAAEYYEKTQEVLEQPATEFKSRFEELNNPPSRVSTQRIGRTAAALIPASKAMRKAAFARVEGEIDQAETYEAEAQLDELPVFFRLDWE